MKIEYRAMIGPGIQPREDVLDVIDWTDPDVPRYETGKARAFVESKVALLGKVRVRDMLSSGWSNGYVRTVVR